MSTSSVLGSERPKAGGILGAYDEWLESSMKPIDEAAAGLTENDSRCKEVCELHSQDGKRSESDREAGTKCKDPPAEFQNSCRTMCGMLLRKRSYEETRKKLRRQRRRWICSVGPLRAVRSVRALTFLPERVPWSITMRCRVEYKGTEHKALHMQYCNGVRERIDRSRNLYSHQRDEAEVQVNSSGVALSSFAFCRSCCCGNQKGSQKEEPKEEPNKKEA